MNMNQDQNQVNRRHFMGMAAITPFALSGTSLLSLTACGGGGSGSAAAYAVKLKFNASSNPATVAQRASVFTDASVDVTYSDGVVKNSKLSFVELYKSGDTLKKPPVKGGGDIVAGGYTKPDGVTAILDTDNKQMFSDCFDGQSLIKLGNPTVTGISGNTLFLVTQFEYKSQNLAGTSMYGKLPSPMTVTTLDQNTTTGALTVKYYYNIPTTDTYGLWITCGGSLSPWNTHLSSEEYEPDAWLVNMRKVKGGALTTTELPAPVSGSTDAGAENVGLQAVDNLNGFAYVMTAFQHAGDLSYDSVNGTGTLNTKTVPKPLMDAIISNWGGINKKSAVGYVSGLPLIP